MSGKLGTRCCFSAKILGGAAASGGNTHVRQARPQALALRRPLHERHEELHGLEHAEGFARGAEGFLRREKRAGLARGREHRRVLKQRDELVLAVRLGEQALELVRVRQGDVHVRVSGAAVRVSSGSPAREGVPRAKSGRKTPLGGADSFPTRVVNDEGFRFWFATRRFAVVRREDFFRTYASQSRAGQSRAVQTANAVLDRSGSRRARLRRRADRSPPQIGPRDRTRRPLFSSAAPAFVAFVRVDERTRAAQRAVSTQRTRWGFPRLCASPRAA